MNWLLTYLATIAIELPLAVLLGGKANRRRMAVDALLLNTFTHPLLTVCLRWQLVDFWVGEVMVWLVEGMGFWILSGLPLRRALLVSAACNGVTVCVALIAQLVL